MTLHQLRIFLSVSRHLNVTQASQELHISQPAVSRQLKLLEDACAAKLYTVGPRGVQLTAKGRLLVNGAEQILCEVDRVKSNLAGQNTSSTLRIGESESLSISSLPSAFVAFHRISPGIQIQLTTDTSQAIEQMVLESKIEVAVITTPSFHASLRYERFRQEKLAFFVSAKHHLAKMDKLRLTDLGRVPLVIKRTGTDGGSKLDQLLANLERKGLRPHIAISCDSDWAVLGAVKAGAGLGILYLEVLAPDIRRRELKLVRINDLKMDVESHIVCHNTRRLSPQAERFCDILRMHQHKSNFGGHEVPAYHTVPISADLKVL